MKKIITYILAIIIGTTAIMLLIVFFYSGHIRIWELEESAKTGILVSYAVILFAGVMFTFIGAIGK